MQNKLPIYFLAYGQNFLISAHRTEQEARKWKDGADEYIMYCPPGSLQLLGHTWYTEDGDPLVYRDAVPWLE